MFISSGSEIYAIDLLTHDTSVVIRGLKDNWAMAIDMKNEKLYFKDNYGISSANLDGTGVEVIIKNANIRKMAIDWIGRRIFWTQKSPYGISVANLNGKERRSLIKASLYLPVVIAVDPIVGYVFLIGITFVVNHNIYFLMITCNSVIIRINAAAFIEFLELKVRRLFEGGVNSRAAPIAHSVKTTVNL